MLVLSSSPNSPILNAGRSAIILTDIQTQQTSGLTCLLSESSCQFTSAFQSAAMRSAVPDSGKLCAWPASSLSPLSPLAGRTAAAPQAEADQPQVPNLKCETLCWQSRCHLKHLGSASEISQAGSELPPSPLGGIAALGDTFSQSHMPISRHHVEPEQGWRLSGT